MMLNGGPTEVYSEMNRRRVGGWVGGEVLGFSCMNLVEHYKEIESTLSILKET